VIGRLTLPARRTRVIGRERELADLRRRVLHGDRRLVTLTGAGGAGKTVLALETSRDVEPSMADGAWFVDLGPVRDPDAVPLVISDALGIAGQERPPLETLADHLAPRQALLVLDNCEHLLPALATTVDALLDACPDLRLLATSRVPLRVSGESVYVVPPFDVPDSGVRIDDLERLAAVPSVELFLERAAAVDPAFQLTPATAPAVASICRRVAGLPLAIELAAAQAAILTPVEIDERLGSMDGLAVADRPGPARQRTMQATLDWSHDLLAPPEQAVYRRLAVFAAGWTLEAAEAVCSLGGDPSTVAASVRILIDHSLVVRDGEGERSRFRMLAPIAEDAERRLAASGELVPAGLAHAGTYLRLTTHEDERFGVDRPEGHDRVAREHDNCLAAIRFCEANPEVPGATMIRLGMVSQLTKFWRVRGHIRLGVRIMSSTLEVVPPGSFQQGALLGVRADFKGVLGEYDVAEADAREAERIFAAIDHLIGVRTVIGVLATILAARGDHELALAEYRRARPLVDAAPSDSVLAFWHAGVGAAELELGDLAAAEQDLTLARDHFSREPSWYQGRVLANLGLVARRQGDPKRAAALLGEALDVLTRYGARVEAIACLEDVARLAIDVRDWRRAATLLGASTGLRDATAATPTARDREQLDADIDGVRARLDAGAFLAAWGRGLGMTLDQATAFALAAPDAPAAVTAPTAPKGSALTAREREIADLVALGLTNREIAERLVISPGTVRIHVERILGKLGRTSRVQVATWVVEERSHEAGAAS
jgi:non-specific serine/threonine protein kinase